LKDLPFDADRGACEVGNIELPARNAPGCVERARSGRGAEIGLQAVAMAAART